MRLALAWGVHLLTASGAVFGTLAILAVLILQNLKGIRIRAPHWFRRLRYQHWTNRKTKKGGFRPLWRKT